MKILDRGPLRTRIRARGRIRRRVCYVIRVEAYAGQPLVRVLHTFIDRDPADTVQVPRMSIDWPVTTAVPALYSAGVDSGAAQSGDAERCRRELRTGRQ